MIPMTIGANGGNGGNGGASGASGVSDANGFVARFGSKECPL